MAAQNGNTATCGAESVTPNEGRRESGERSRSSISSLRQIIDLFPNKNPRQLVVVRFRTRSPPYKP